MCTPIHVHSMCTHTEPSDRGPARPGPSFSPGLCPSRLGLVSAWWPRPLAVKVTCGPARLRHQLPVGGPAALSLSGQETQACLRLGFGLTLNSQPERARGWQARARRGESGAGHSDVSLSVHMRHRRRPSQPSGARRCAPSYHPQHKWERNCTLNRFRAHQAPGKLWTGAYAFRICSSCFAMLATWLWTASYSSCPFFVSPPKSRASASAVMRTSDRPSRSGAGTTSAN